MILILVPCLHRGAQMEVNCKRIILSWGWAFSPFQLSTTNTVHQAQKGGAGMRKDFQVWVALRKRTWFESQMNVAVGWHEVRHLDAGLRIEFNLTLIQVNVTLSVSEFLCDAFPWFVLYTDQKHSKCIVFCFFQCSHKTFWTQAGINNTLEANSELTEEFITKSTYVKRE